MQNEVQETSPLTGALRAGNTAISSTRRRVSALVLSIVLLLCLFSKPLAQLVWFAVHSSLYSHILLIPFISLYLASKRWHALVTEEGYALIPALAALFFGMLLLFPGLPIMHHYIGASLEDRLAFSVLSLLLIVLGVGFFFLGVRGMRALALPWAFLLFAVPFPTEIRKGLETILQLGSAEAASMFFSLSGMPVFRHGLRFQLPGFSLQIAPECSGIHSSLVLFITSVLAGGLYLNGPWRRTLLCLVVIPLALVRNGFRVLVIGYLCVKAGPGMINSPIHRHGGPIFFVLSLIPFFFILFWLRKTETPVPQVETQASGGSEENPNLPSTTT